VEFDFRYSNRSALGIQDMDRAVKLTQGIVGKRLNCRRTNESASIRENKMAKKLEELSQSDKIDDLRKDVKTIFSHLNSHDEAIRNMTLELETIVNLLKEVAETVKKLEKH